MIALLLSVVLRPVQEQAALPRALPREERTIEADVVRYRADVGRVLVAADRARPEAGHIELATARLRGGGPEGAAPIVFLAGGPGPGATELIGRELWADYLALGDVLLIDQRGCGRTRPSLAVEDEAFDPATQLGEREGALAALLPACARAAAALAEEGVRLADYTTSASADDVADVLDVLGYERARVLAHSYGTLWALELLRRHPGRVERCALLGMAGPDDLLKPAGELEPFVRELARRAAAGSEGKAALPDLERALDEALARARREPLRVRVQDGEAERTIAVGAFGLQRILLADLGDRSDLPVLPRLIAEVARGETDTLAWFAAKRLRGASRLPLAAYALRGSAGVSDARRARLERDARTSRFADARNYPFPEIVAALGIPAAGAAFREPVASDVPTLLVSGTLDASTPPAQAEAVRRTLARTGHLVVEEAGHEDLLFEPEVRARVAAFLGGAAPEDATIALAPLSFAPLRGPSDAHPALAAGR